MRAITLKMFDFFTKKEQPKPTGYWQSIKGAHESGAEKIGTPNMSMVTGAAEQPKPTGYWQSVKGAYETGAEKIGKRNMAMVTGAAVGVASLPLSLSLAGFSATGVVAGSLAAGVQSVFYGAATTGVFSTAQSAGVLGIGYVTAAVGGVVGGFAGRLVVKPEDQNSKFD